MCEAATLFNSAQWDAMQEAGWAVRKAAILNGAVYVLAPWLNKEISNIRTLVHLKEGKDTGFWM